MTKDIIIVDYISRITTTELSDAGKEALDRLSIRVKNLRKYRGRIEIRKEKIKRIYG